LRLTFPRDCALRERERERERKRERGRERGREGEREREIRVLVLVLVFVIERRHCMMQSDGTTNNHDSIRAIVQKTGLAGAEGLNYLPSTAKTNSTTIPE
jgi:hypothetical protein